VPFPPVICSTCPPELGRYGSPWRLCAPRTNFSLQNVVHRRSVFLFTRKSPSYLSGVRTVFLNLWIDGLLLLLTSRKLNLVLTVVITPGGGRLGFLFRKKLCQLGPYCFNRTIASYRPYGFALFGCRRILASLLASSSCLCVPSLATFFCFCFFWVLLLAGSAILKPFVS